MVHEEQMRLRLFSVLSVSEEGGGHIFRSHGEAQFLFG
jgi:hypothetical protein